MPLEAIKFNCNPYRLFQHALDLAVAAAAFFLAYLIRFEGQIPAEFQQQLLGLAPALIAIRLLMRFPMGLHQQLWRYVSWRDSMAVAVSVLSGSACLWLYSRYIAHQHVPLSVLTLDAGLCIAGYLGLRGMRRFQKEGRFSGTRARLQSRVLVIGAGQAGSLYVREIASKNAGQVVIGFLDDDAQKHGSTIQGIKVLGPVASLPALIERYRADKIVLCVPSASSAERRRILDVCRKVHVRVRTLPNLADIVSGKLAVSRVREVDIEDLLGRQRVELDHSGLSAYLAGRTILITGAGGSIGSELCRQISAFNPRRLILVGRGEFSIYTIEQELRESYSTLEFVSVIADVRDARRMRQIFEQYGPEVVFHAAAHKHVPLMEQNPSEAVNNNIVGTRIVAELAHETGCEAFVLISTDKAVNPTNVMGATKRVAELLVQSMAAQSSTRFMCVRFGNVLGSRGSVIPLFKRQIAAGGPVTVTHPDVIRYFMTIPEASQLVLQAGALGKGGEVFVLDMGEPIRIADLARDMIRLSGFVPDEDIAIQFTGLRPGEKLYEELLTAEEGTLRTDHRKIFIAHPIPIAKDNLDVHLNALVIAAGDGNDFAVRKSLKDLVDGYQFIECGVGVPA